MKLRLPSKLQAALIATLASAAFTTLSTGSTAQGITVTQTQSTITVDTTKDYNENGVVYDATSGDLTGSQFITSDTNAVLTFTLDNDKLKALGNNGQQKLVYVSISGATTTWGFYATGSNLNNKIVGLWNGNLWSETNTDTTYFVSQDELTPLLQADGKSVLLTANMVSGSNGTRMFAGEGTTGTALYNRGNLTASSKTITKLTLNKDLISSFQYKVAGDTTVSAGGWSKTYATVAMGTISSTPVNATLVTSMNNKLQVTDSQAVTLSANGGDIVVGGNSALFLQTYGGSGAINLSNDIYIGSSTQSEAGTWGVLRIGSDSHATNITGTVTLVEDSSIGSNVTGGNDVNFTGTVTEAEAHTLTLKRGQKLHFNNMSVTKLDVNGNNGSNGVYADFAGTVQLGELAFTNVNSTVTVLGANGAMTVGKLSGTGGTLSVTNGSDLNITTGEGESGSFAGTLTTDGKVVKSGAGMQTIGTFSGGIEMQAGTLVFTNAATASILTGVGEVRAQAGISVGAGTYSGTLTTPTLAVTGGEAFTLAGGATLGSATTLSSGSLTIGAAEAAAVTFNGTITNAGTGTITLAGTGTISGDLDNYTLVEQGSGTRYTGDTDHDPIYKGSGYIAGSDDKYALVTTGGGNLSVDPGFTLTNAVRTTEVSGHDNDYIFMLQLDEPDHTVYYVNGDLPYTDAEMGEAQILQIATGKTLTAGGAPTTQKTLAGTGTYKLASGDYDLTANMVLGENWTGMVEVSGKHSSGATNLSSLHTDNSRVLLSGASFWFQPGTITANLVLNDSYRDNGQAGDANTAAMQINGANSNTYTFSGSISGAGDFAYTQTDARNATFKFQGDISQWTGAIVNYSAGNPVTYQIDRSGDITLANDLVQRASGTMDVKLGNTDATTATVTGAVEVHSGTMRFRLHNGSAQVVNLTGGVTMDDGTTLFAYYNSYNGTEIFNVGNVTMTGATATIGASTGGHGGIVNITGVTGSGTLNLVSAADSSARSLISLGTASDPQTPTFSGNIDMKLTNTGGERTLVTVLKGEYTAASSVVEFGVSGTGTNRVIAMGIDSSNVRVLGLNDMSISGGTTASQLDSNGIFSGSGSSLNRNAKGITTTYLDHASDDTVRTLTITGTGAYSTSIRVLENVSLAMNGSGTQTFSGDMSRFNGSLSAYSGTLKFTHAGGIAATGLVGMGGSLDVAGTLTLNSDDKLGNAFDGGSLSLGGLVVNGNGTGVLAISGIDRLGSTIQVNAGSLNVMEGTYNLSGLTATGGGTPVPPTDRSGYAALEATVQFITTGEGGSFWGAESGLTFTYKGATSNTLNANGTVEFNDHDYTTYYLVGEGDVLDLNKEQTDHSMLENVVLNASAGTISLTGDRTLATLTQAAGSNLTLAGGGKLTNASPLVAGTTITFADGTTLDNANADLTLEANQSFTTAKSAESTGKLIMHNLHVSGNNAVATLGAEAELHQITMGAGTVNLNGNTTLERFVLSLNNAASTMNIGKDANVHVTGTTLSVSNSNASFMVSNYGQTNTLNIEGTLIAEAGISSRDGRANVNVKGGGTLELHQGLLYTSNSNGAVNINVQDGGTLLTAGNTTDYTNKGLHVNLADGSTLQGYYGDAASISIGQALTLSGSTRTAVIEAANGKTMTIAAAIGGTGGFTKTGTGTLVLSGTNSYAGGTVVDAGTLRATSTTALGSDSLTLNAGSTLEVQTDTTVDLLDVTVAGDATISNAGTLKFTGKGGINVAAGASITLAGTGTYDLSGMDVESGGNVEYSGGASGTNNGFAKANGVIDFITFDSATGSSIVYNAGQPATFLYKNSPSVFNPETGKVEVAASTPDMTTFYVNEQEDYVSNAKASEVLTRIELASNVTIHVDGNNTIDVSLIQPQATATGYTIDVMDGSTMNMALDTDTSAITGAGRLVIDNIAAGTAYTASFNADQAFTGTLVFSEVATAGNHNAKVTLDDTFAGTLELHGRMNGHAMNLGGATTLRLVGDRSGNYTTGLWSQGGAINLPALEVTGDNTVDLWSDGGTIINGTVNSGTNRQGHLNKRENGTMTFNGAAALAEFTTPGGTVNFEAAANIGTVNANGGTVNFKGDSSIGSLNAGATTNLSGGAAIDALNLNANVTVSASGEGKAYNLGAVTVAYQKEAAITVGSVGSATAKSIFVGDQAKLTLTLGSDMTVSAPAEGAADTDGALYTMGAGKTSIIKSASAEDVKTLTVGKLDLSNSGTVMELQNVNLVVTGAATVGVLVTDRGSDNATMRVASGATLSLNGSVAWNSVDSLGRTDKVALVVENGGIANVNGGMDNKLDAVTLNAGGKLNFASSTSTEIVGPLALADTITNAGSVTIHDGSVAADQTGTLSGNGAYTIKGTVAATGTLKLDGTTVTGAGTEAAPAAITGNVDINGGTIGGTLNIGSSGSTVSISDVFTVAEGTRLDFAGPVVLDALAKYATITYTDAEVDTVNNGFIDGLTVRVYNPAAVEDVTFSGSSVTYAGIGGLIIGGVFNKFSATDYTTFHVNVATETAETYSHAKEMGGTAFTKLSLEGNGVSFDIDSDSAALASVNVKEGAAASLTIGGSNTTITAVETGAELTLTGEGSLTLGSAAADHSLNGAGTLVIDGPTVTINGTNNTSFTGNVDIKSGTLKLGESASNKYVLGDYNYTAGDTRTITVRSGATLDINGKADANYVLTLDGGRFTNNSNTDVTVGSSQVVGLKLTANSYVGESGHSRQFWLRERTNKPAPILELNEFNLTKQGTSTFGLHSTTVTGTGYLVVEEGTVQLDGGTFGANFRMAGGTVTGTVNLSAATTIETTAASTFSAAIAAGANNVAFSGAGNLTASGVVSGSASVTKTGTGTVTLSGANTYTGGTTISAGTVETTNATALGTGNVTVASTGTLLVSQNLTIKGDGTANHKGIDNQGTVSIADGKTLSLYGLVTNKQYDLGTVNVLGTTATIENTNHRGTINLGGITGATGSTVTLFSNHSSDPATWNLGTAASGSFAGEKLVLLVGDNTTSGGARTVSYNFNNGDMFSGTTVQLENATVTKSKTMTNNVVLNAATVKVGGISDAAEGTVASNRVWSISKGNAAGARATLELDGNDANGYSSAVKVGANIDIKKTGSATQTFNGDLSAMNGAVTVNNGTLTLSNSGAERGMLASVTVTGGSLVLNKMNVAGAISVTEGAMLDLGQTELTHAITTTATETVEFTQDITATGLGIGNRECSIDLEGNKTNGRNFFAGTEDYLTVVTGGGTVVTNGHKVTQSETDYLLEADGTASSVEKEVDYTYFYQLEAKSTLNYSDIFAVAVTGHGANQLWVQTAGATLNVDRLATGVILDNGTVNMGENGSFVNGGGLYIHTGVANMVKGQIDIAKVMFASDQTTATLFTNAPVQNGGVRLSSGAGSMFGGVEVDAYAASGASAGSFSNYSIGSTRFTVAADEVAKVENGDVSVKNGVYTTKVHNSADGITGKLTLDSGVLAQYLDEVVATSGDVEFNYMATANGSAAAAAVSLSKLEIGAGKVVGFYEAAAPTSMEEMVAETSVTVTGTLTAGAGARLNADLNMASGSTLDVSATGGMGLLMGSDVTLNRGNILAVGGSDVDSYLREYFGGSTTKLYTLYYGTEADPLHLFIGDQAVTQNISFQSWDKPFMDASDIYTNLQSKTYYLVYDGSNVGMVAIGFVPEPATSTLSLLALCALAARRRRK